MTALALATLILLVAFRRRPPAAARIALVVAVFLRWPWRSVARALIWRAIYRSRR